MALIIDMEMPKACVWGKASHVLDVCNMIHRCPYAKASAEKRPEGCLIKGEIPDKHGRLIDADVLKGILSRVPSKGIRDYFFAEVGQFIDEAPTVLEASYSCEDCHWFRPNPITWECCHEQGECNGERFEQAEP